ncbi:MAG TPA: hypothetical protein VFZ83_15590 [Acidimicrobiia bacterium]|nr:hypothetical protein [Acidimicrobiia bacterium]
MQRVLVLGAPRTATTWIGEALGHADATAYVHEPDGVEDPFAFRAKRALAHHPVLEPGADAADYARLWAGAFSGGAPAGTRADRLARALFARTTPEERRRAREGRGTSVRIQVVCRLARPRVAPAPPPAAVVVKSVHAALAADWIVDRFAPRVVVTHRNPLNVMASWLELGFPNTAPSGHHAVVAEAHRRWGLTLPGHDAPPLERDSAYLGTLLCALHEHVARHPDWIVVSHEAACVEPASVLRELAARLGLVWGDAAEQFVAASDRPGHGWATQRVASTLSEKWRDQLDPAQVATIRATLARFPYDLFEPPR